MENNNFAMVKILLEHGMDPNTIMSDGTPALYAASLARKNSLKIITLLCEHENTDVNKKWIYGNKEVTPLSTVIDVADSMRSPPSSITAQK